MPSAQSSLEYLVIIAAVLGLAAAVVMILSSSFSTGANSASYNACKEAAAQCAVSRHVSIKDPCQSCVQACSDQRTGQELFIGAINCCNSTAIEKIYSGSPGCPPYTVPTPQVCGNNIREGTEQCDGTDNSLCAGQPCKADCTCQVVTTPVCGNGIKEGTEACDGNDMGTCTNPSARCTAGCKCQCSDGTLAGSCSKITDASYCDSSGSLVPSSPLCPISKIYSTPFEDIMADWVGSRGGCSDTVGWCVANGKINNAANMRSIGQYNIRHAQSTVGYKDIQLSFWAFFCGDPAEYLQVDWSGDGGSTWTNLLTTTSIFDWTFESYNLPASASQNPNFVVRLNAYGTHGWSTYAAACVNHLPYTLITGSRVDELNISGWPT